MTDIRPTLTIEDLAYRSTLAQAVLLRSYLLDDDGADVSAYQLSAGTLLTREDVWHAVAELDEAGLVDVCHEGRRIKSITLLKRLP